MCKLDFELQTELVDVANAMADAARPVTLKHFRSSFLRAENKLDAGFDPVTIADRDAESVMRAVLEDLRPDDGILGEEFDDKPTKSGLTWVLDPIDGTRGYISGTPTWGTLIAVNQGSEPLFGMIDQPYIGERFSGGFGKAELQTQLDKTALAVRPTSSLENAVIFTTFPEVGTAEQAGAFQQLASKCLLTRYGMDCYAYALLAAGQVDLVVEAGLNAYDIQGPQAVVTGAGGIVTNWQGGPAHNGGTVVAAATKELHEQALQVLSPYGP